MITQLSYSLSPATTADLPAIEHLLDLGFGLARRTKTSYRLREGASPIAGLSHVIREEGLGIVGAISYWPIAIGEAGAAALLLGPLAVHPQRQNRGIGLALMQQTLAMAKEMGHELVLLIGDLPYYARVGFEQAPEGQFLLPGPFDPKRLLYLELVPGALQKARGLVIAAHRHRGHGSHADPGSR